MRSKISASSLTSAIFRSRWVFSITLAASATLMLLALCTPAPHHRGVERGHLVRVSASSPADHFDDPRQCVLLVAGVYPLRRVSRRESPATTAFSELRSSTGMHTSSDRAGMADGGLEHHRRAALHVAAADLAGPSPVTRSRDCDQRRQGVGTATIRKSARPGSLGSSVTVRLRAAWNCSRGHLAGGILAALESDRSSSTTGQSRSSRNPCRTTTASGSPTSPSSPTTGDDHMAANQRKPKIDLRRQVPPACCRSRTACPRSGSRTGPGCRSGGPARR